MGFSTGRFAGQPIRRCFVYSTWLQVKVMFEVFGCDNKIERRKCGRCRINSSARLKQLRCEKLKRGTSRRGRRAEDELTRPQDLAAGSSACSGPQ